MHGALLAVALMRAEWSFQLAGSAENRFEDDAIVITWAKSGTFQFALHNKTAQPIELLWDEATYVDGDGRMHCLPGGNGWMRPWADFCRPFVPGDTVRWGIDQAGTETWLYAPLLPPVVQADAKPQHLKAMLPIRIGGTTRDYEFRFEATPKLQPASPYDIEADADERKRFDAADPEPPDVFTEPAETYCNADEARDDALARSLVPPAERVPHVRASIDGSGKRNGLFVSTLNWDDPESNFVFLFDTSATPPKLLAKTGPTYATGLETHDFNHDRIDELLISGIPGNRATPETVWRFDGENLVQILDDEIAYPQFIDFDGDGVDEILVSWAIYKLQGNAFQEWRKLDFYQELSYSDSTEFEFHGRDPHGVMTIVNTRYDVDPAPPVEIALNGRCLSLPPMQREVRIPVELERNNVITWSMPDDIGVRVMIEQR